MSSFVKDFILPKYNSAYRQNVLMDMAEFERRYSKFITDIRSHNEDGQIVVTYYLDYDKGE